MIFEFSPGPHRACGFHRTRRSIDFSTGGCSSNSITKPSKVVPPLSVSVRLLICFVSLCFHRIPFHVPMILSLHIPLGASYGPDGWRARAALYGGSYTTSYLTTPSAHLRPDISACVIIDPFIRWFVRLSPFSPWVFYRPPAYKRHCVSRFRCICTTVAFCRLYRASDT